MLRAILLFPAQQESIRPMVERFVVSLGVLVALLLLMKFTFPTLRRRLKNQSPNHHGISRFPQIRQMRKRGQISEEEFDNLKRTILARDSSPAMYDDASE